MQGGVAHRRQNYLSIVKTLSFSKLPQHDVSVLLDDPDASNDRKVLVREQPGSDSDSEEESTEKDSQLFQVRLRSAV